MKKKIRVHSEYRQCLYSQNIEYFDYGNCKRHLQILFPLDIEESKYPLILFIPGSAWHKQELYNDVPQYSVLAKRGYVVAVMEYRESDIATFPAQIEDVSNALRFLPSVSDVFHIDLNKIFIMGNSSGGHIAMMSLLFNAHKLCNPLPEIAGIICESASTDILICSKSPLPSWMKVRPSAVLLIHSENDPVVSVENSRILYNKLSETKHKVEYYEIEESDAHGGAVFYEDCILDIIQKFCSECLDNL